MEAAIDIFRKVFHINYQPQHLWRFSTCPFGQRSSCTDLLLPFAIGYSDWLCASCSVTILSNVLYSTNVFSGQTNIEPILCTLCFSNLIINGVRSVPSFPVFMFWSTGTRLAPSDVKETYGISRKRRTYMLLCS